MAKCTVANFWKLLILAHIILYPIAVFFFSVVWYEFIVIFKCYIFYPHVYLLKCKLVGDMFWEAVYLGLMTFSLVEGMEHCDQISQLALYALEDSISSSIGLEKTVQIRSYAYCSFCWHNLSLSWRLIMAPHELWMEYDTQLWDCIMLRP